jgi:hypothetical protein
MICGQRNFWISGYKHTVKQMNQYRFHFFYIIFKYFNEIKEESFLNILMTFTSRAKDFLRQKT